ncbi:UvrD-helicase domain-containing protein [Alkalilacustris brevis]|uniref:UvrD-helicase domain-containing protein n=1 Tax=Alkalilacustris brevis TaxID=2026338 RepID=UPI000E0D78DA|nr:UvrD-helicase domain-containing protein [Alkalilacustris brevis]
MPETLTIVPAGAGSGKTFHIKSELARLVKAGQVRPERIMAVTFTEAAAGELRERIRATLLAEGLVEEALAVERAYVSTIHGLGLRILTEHAFAAGRSPQPRHISEAERELLIREELAHCEAFDAIKRDLPRHGYKAQGWNGTTIEDDFRNAVFGAIDLLRGLGDGGTDPALAIDAEAALRAAYGKVSKDPGKLDTRLQTAAAQLLEEFPEGGTPYNGTTKAARDDFRAQLAALRAASAGRAQSRDWAVWETLRSLRTKARGADIPERFVTLSEDVMAAAEGALVHPGPLEDACTNLRALILGAQAIMAGYAERKRSAGVIDFADMIVDAERLLREHPEVLRAIIEDADCVIVDEFQDTNPVQFALLWRIAQAAPRTLLVGDTKQSIMGFQGADPRLTEALVAQFPDNVMPLARNWRSDPRVMGLVNALGARLFPGAYVALAPQRHDTGQTALEFLRIPQGRRSNKSRPEQHVAARIKAILDDGDTIIDRHSPIDAPRPRRVRPGDIAILCRTHAQAGRYADSLQELGVPVRINRMGWMQAPPVAAARHALALAADPADTHAALSLLTLGPAAMPLQEAMSALADGTLLDDPALGPVRQLSALAATAPLGVVLSEVIAAADLRDWAARLPDAAQMRADLLRLEAEAQTFEAAHRDMKAAAGFYGHGAQVFLGWLEARRLERDFDRHPDPGSGAAEGVQVVTWHSSKGREWNITVVVGLDTTITERPGTLRAEFADFSELGDVLARARLRLTPVLPIKDKQAVFLEAKRDAAQADARRLLYVALTRARDRLVLEWPDFKLKKPSDGPGPGNYAEMLADECGLEVQAGKAAIGKERFAARILECGDAPPPEFDDPEEDWAAPRPAFGEPRARRAITPTLWRRRPSQATSIPLAAAPAVEIIDLGTPVALDGEAPEPADLRGTAWHLALRTALARPDLQDRAGAATGLGPQTLTAIAAQADALRRWLEAKGYARLHVELPIQIEAASGAQTNAIIDLLAEGENGFLIVDHKSGGAEDLAARHATYQPQLSAYAEAVATQFPDKPVRGTAINWMRRGSVTLSNGGEDN